jgi:hypothetical protein
MLPARDGQSMQDAGIKGMWWGSRKPRSSSSGAGSPFSFGPLASFGVQFKASDKWSADGNTIASGRQSVSGNKSYRAPAALTVDKPTGVSHTDYRFAAVYHFSRHKTLADVLNPSRTNDALSGIGGFRMRVLRVFLRAAKGHSAMTAALTRPRFVLHNIRVAVAAHRTGHGCRTIGDPRSAAQAVERQFVTIVGVRVVAGTTLIEQSAAAHGSGVAESPRSSSGTGGMLALQKASRAFEVSTLPAGKLRAFLRPRVLSIHMLLELGVLLAISLALRRNVVARARSNADFTHTYTRPDLAISVATQTVVFSSVYRFIPNAKMAWRDVWIGGLATAVRFEAGKFIIGLFLARPSRRRLRRWANDGARSRLGLLRRDHRAVRG